MEKNVLHFFRLFFDDNVLKLLVDKSNRYAFQRNDNLYMDSAEMLCFLGIIILSAYSKLPRSRLYWDEKDDVRNSFVAKSMRRDRFEKIKKYFQAADNTNLPVNNKFGKLRPLI